MRAHLPAVVLLLGGLIPLWAGCGHAETAPSFSLRCPYPFQLNEQHRGLREGCARDADCVSGFCDRGRCAVVAPSIPGYGDVCELNDELRSSYPCIDGRERSC